MKFITVIYFTDDKSRKCIFIENPNEDCLSASKYSQAIDIFTLIPNSAKNIRVRTYEMGSVSYELN